jgi:hypothetical protein
VPPAPASSEAPPASRDGRVELADIVRAPGAAYQRTHGLARAQGRALRAIAQCRTAALGGHRAVCTTCGAERLTYTSCRNRHCPKCQRVTTERWLAARQRELLPIEYFHVVFTLPHALNPLAHSHPRLIYRLLFRAAASTLTRFGRDPRHLGGDVGVTAVLHTWGQTLTQHVHLHCLVTGGALAPDGTRWIAAHPSFLFPVRALAQVFRGCYLARLQRACARGQRHFTGGIAALAEPAASTRGLPSCGSRPGSSTANRPSPGLSMSWPTSGGPPTAWRSPTTGSSGSPTTASASAGATTPTATA